MTEELRSCTREEFWEHITKNNAVADGFKLVGAYQQTKWFVGEQEIARWSCDSFGDIYEIRPLDKTQLS